MILEYMLRKNHLIVVIVNKFMVINTYLIPVISQESLTKITKHKKNLI